MAHEQSREELIHWLNDAHGMEVSMIRVLENHVKDAERYPGLQAQLKKHLDETRRQAEKVKHCIESLGSEVSKGKSLFSEIFGRVQGVVTGLASDEIVKNTLADYAAEHFEIACYRSLIAASEELGEEEIARECREILAQEEAAAKYLEERIPKLTRDYLRGQESRL